MFVGSGRIIAALLSGSWNRDSDGPLRWNRVRIERHFVVSVEAIPGRIDNRGSNKNDEVLFAGGARLAAEQTADQREIAEDGDLVFDFGDILSNQAAKYDGLAIPHDGAGGDLTKPEVRQRQLARNGTPGPEPPLTDWPGG